MNPSLPALTAGRFFRRRPRRKQGFALVVTLALMVLLSLLAVGLLGLSSVELRTSSRGSAMAQAQANARLALQIAIGELQLHAGPDQRITATSDIVGGNHRFTGVWDSKKLDPTNPQDLYQNKDDNFRKWLVSHPDTAATEDLAYATASLTNSVDLVSENLVGSGPDAGPVVRVERVPVKNQDGSNDPTGYYAYATLDEAVKARVDLGEVAPTGSDLASATKTLGVGQSPGIDRVEGLTIDGSTNPVQPISATDPNIAKTISLPQAELSYSATPGSFRTRFHDLTTQSLGVMTDVVNGGLKKDLNLLTEHTPSGFSSSRIYESAYPGLNAAAQPKWGQALGYANLFNSSNFSGGQTPTITAGAPNGWRALTSDPSMGDDRTEVNRDLPDAPVMMPALAKVQVVYSWVVRDALKHDKLRMRQVTPTMIKEEGFNVVNSNNNNVKGGFGHLSGWQGNSPPTIIGTAKDEAGNYKDTPHIEPSNYTFKVHLVYAPLVTLHNPYNVAIRFDRLRVSFRNVPMAMKITAGNFGNPKLVPFNRFSNGNRGGKGAKSKAFGLNIESDTLMPGETKMYSINIDGMESWVKEGGGKNWEEYIKWFSDTGKGDGAGGSHVTENRQQEFLPAGPGWRGAQYGLDMDLLMGERGTGPHQDTPSYNYVDDVNGISYNGAGYIPVRPGANVSVEVALLPNEQLENDKNKFSVEMRLLQPGEADLNDPEKPLISPCVKVVEFDYGSPNGLLNTLPNGGTVFSDPTLGDGYYAKWDTALKDQFVYSFAMFSAYAKTTHGAYAGNADGSYPAKPWIFNNHTASAEINDVVNVNPSHQTYEINLEKLPGHPDEKIDNQGGGMTSFITGHSVDTGRQFGTFHDVPLSPIYSPIELNGANLGATYTSPQFAAPIGNAIAHPALSTETVYSADGRIDHSYLLNSILFDEYFCSGLQSGPSATLNSLVGQFLSNNASNMPDQRFIPYFPEGEDVDSATSALTIASNNTHLKAGSHMVLKGAFNVNSTSKEAWKAVLASMSGEGARILSQSMGVANADSMDSTGGRVGARFSRFRLPNANFKDGDSYWQRFNDLTYAELDDLAEKVVEEIKNRGPFLSLGEFVNRRVGSSNDERVLYGAIQAAINRTSINDLTPADGDDEGDPPGYTITQGQAEDEKYAFTTPETMKGLSSVGAPGYLMQSDLLKVLGNSATVRSDTFVIRAYGDSVDASGNILAKAYCEAVVQRVPDYVDSSESPETSYSALNSINQTYGRKFIVQSFRWLNPSEI